MNRTNCELIPQRLRDEVLEALLFPVDRSADPETLRLEFGLVVLLKLKPEEDNFTSRRGRSWRRKQRRLRLKMKKSKAKPKKKSRKDRYYRVFSNGY
jgi:hypothetical protein